MFFGTLAVRNRLLVAHGICLTGMTLLVVSCSDMNVGVPMPQLVASVAVDSHELRENDELRVQATLRNVSATEIYLLTRQPPYATTNIKLYDGQTELKSFPKLIFELAPLKKEDFAKVSPNGDVIFSFTGTARQETIRDVTVAGRNIVRGLFLDFGTAAILIPRKATYSLRFEMQMDKDGADSASKKFGLQNVWHGQVISEPITVTIR